MELIKKSINTEVLVVFIISYPFLILPWNIYFLSLTKLIYLATFTVILWAVFSLHRVKDKKLLFVPNTNAERLLLVFLIFMGLSTLMAQDPMTSFVGSFSKYQGFIAWFGYITLFLFTYHLVPLKKQMLVIKLMVYASFFCAIYGIIQHFFLEVLIGREEEASFIRSWAFFDNPNHFGSYLVLMMTVGMTLFLLAENRKQIFIQGSILNTLFISLLYTNTRGAWIGVFIGAFLLTSLIVRKRRELMKRWITLLVSFFIVLQIINISENNLFFNRIISLGNDVNTIVSDEGNDGDAGSNRWGIWKKCLPIIKENYLIGTGLNSFSLVFPFSVDDEKVDNSHNEYIEIAMAMGIPALLVYLAFILTILKSSFDLKKKLTGDKEIYLYGLNAAIISYLIKVIFNISVVPVAPFFWVLLGMCYAFSMKVKTLVD